MFASIHLWASKLAAPRVRQQPDIDDCWHLNVDTADCHGHVVLTGTRDELRAYVASLVTAVEAIPETVKAAA